MITPAASQRVLALKSGRFSPTLIQLKKGHINVIRNSRNKFIVEGLVQKILKIKRKLAESKLNNPPETYLS